MVPLVPLPYNRLMRIRRVCVFCGSKAGARPEYMESARQTGQLLAERGIGLVYGGASIGTMGALANGALAAGGEVIGVIPRSFVDREIAHSGLSQLHLVGSMHERKALMVELADGFVALPGGSGTLDEFFEVFTWAQLGFHDKPCAFIDVRGYYQPLIAFLDHAVDEHFISRPHRDKILVAPDAATVLDTWS